MQVLRQKLKLTHSPDLPLPDSGAAQLSLAICRMAELGHGLPVRLLQAESRSLSLAEMAELIPDRALISLLDTPQKGLGVLIFSAQFWSALVEYQTLGQLREVLLPRLPTRTDAAMLAPAIDLMLEDCDQAASVAILPGLRYASHISEPRLLGLLLEDLPYHCLRFKLTLAATQRQGEVWLFAPQPKPEAVELPPQAQAEQRADFSQRLSAAVMPSTCKLDAVVARLQLPLTAVLGLQPGQLLGLADAALDQIAITGMDGAVILNAKLGQHQGMRALRLAEPQPPQPEADFNLAGAAWATTGTTTGTATALPPQPLQALPRQTETPGTGIAPQAPPEAETWAETWAEADTGNAMAALV